jgi:prepilin-type N-terminal cleavage/methylation domain-containing protein
MGENITTSSRTRFERGYTMIEVIVAASIMSVMFVSLYTGISFGFSVSRTERENLRATQIILERMEGIRLFTYDQLSDTNLNPPIFTQNYYPQALTNQSQGITYTGTMTVESNITLDP